MSIMTTHPDQELENIPQTALETENYLQTRAARASREAFDAALAGAPDVEPELEDRL